ncbi:MAG: hypothetical protein LBV45_03140 [Xanthomonadaceae bacterium]|jgi:hypothetical protein|nr:hypothetical protein [Xanthomonadaceae bacterium]
MQATNDSTHATPKFWKTLYGMINIVPDENLITSSLENYGEWAENELDLLSELLQEGAVIVEMGSEYGVHALCLSHTVGDSGEIHVLEADRMIHLQLCANIAINGLNNVYPHLTSNRKRELTLEDLDLNGFQLLKVNTPGKLLSILARDKECLNKHKPYIYFRLSSPQQARKEVEAIKALGYRCWSHIAYLYNPDNQADNPVDLFPGWAHQNIIAVPVELEMEADFEHLREI